MPLPEFVFPSCVHHPHWNSLYALHRHMFTSASVSPPESLRDTVTQPWTLSQLCWWSSMAGVVWLPPYTSAATEMRGMGLSQESVLLLPLLLFLLKIPSVLKGICGMRTSRRVGEWKWSGGQGGDLFSSGVTTCWIICRDPPVLLGGCVVPHTWVPSCVFCSGFAFSCIL